METFKPLQGPQTDVGDDFAIGEAFFGTPSLFGVGMMEGTTSSYTAMILRGELPQPRANDDGDNKDNDAGPVHGPRTLSSIELARKAGLFLFGVAVSEHYLYIIFS